MKLLELFAGSRSFCKEAEKAGWETFSSDFKPFEGIDYVVNILEFDVNKVPFIPDVIHASPPCFLGRELVLTARGHVPISEVVVGDLVLTHKSRWRRVEAVGAKKATALRKLKGYGVHEIGCTPNHPFLVRERKSWGTKRGGKSIRKTEFGDSSWEEAKGIDGKHWALPISAEPLSHWMLMDPYVIGRWLGDGWASVEHRTVSICCSHEEKDSLMEKLMRTGHLWHEETRRTTCVFHLYNVTIAAWLINNFGKGAGGKLIPGWVFGADETIRKSILEGYIDSDGYRTVRTKGGTELIKTSTISKPLAHGIAFLARTLELSATISKTERSKTAVIQGRTVRQSDSWDVAISNRNPDRKFYTILDDGLGYGAVRSVEIDRWNSLVYDIQVEEDHSYTINNVVVHNCTGFSVAAIGHNWAGGKGAYIPKSETAKLGIKLAQKAIEIIEHFRRLNPNLIWYMENPRGVMRKMPFMEVLPLQNTVTYCSYKDSRMKPTDFWTNNPMWVPRKMCKNNGYGKVEVNGQTWVLNEHGGPCHIAAPRGAKTGTQGLKGDYERSKIPQELCEELVNAANMYKQWGSDKTDPKNIVDPSVVKDVASKKLHSVMLKHLWYHSVGITDKGLIIYAKEDLDEVRQSMVPRYIDGLDIELKVIGEVVPAENAHSTMA